MFTGFDEDGAALYDTKESAIERAQMLKIWDQDLGAKIMAQRTKVPLWFAHLVRGTWFEFLAYEEMK